MYIFSLSGFIAALAIHFLTVLGVNYFALSNYTFILHGLLFIPFFGMIISAKTNYPNLEKGGFNKLLFSNLPLYLNWFTKLVFVYAVLNFIFSISLLEEGSPTIKDGIYILENKGSYVRDISLSEYYSLKRMELRAFSGHWLVFFLLPALYFKYANKST